MKLILQSLKLNKEYLNVHSEPNQIKDFLNDYNIAICHFSNLDPIVENNTVEEIKFGLLANVLDPKDILSVFEHWFKKLKSGGILTIAFLDVNLGSKQILEDPTNHQLYNGIFNNKFKCILNTIIFEELCRNIGFKINHREKDTNQFFIYTLIK